MVSQATDPKKIFISSTAEDLVAHREAVRDTIDHYGQVAVRMESFGARPGDSLKTCQELAKDAAAVVVLVAYRLRLGPHSRAGWRR